MQTTTETTPGIPDRIARYRVREKLGEDAFGAIYLAADENARERGPVRVRVLPESVRLEPDRRARLIEDARKAMDIEHPGLAPLYDVGDDARGLFLVSQPEPGRTLREYIADKQKLDLAEALRVAQEIASAIAAVHRAGLVHGALSDERVIIDDAGRAHVIDVGLAELVRPVIDRADGMDELDPRTDVYAIGAMLHEAITGSRVSTNELSSVPPERLPSLDVVARGVPAPLAMLVRRATSPDRAERPADADALLTALSEIDLPVEPVADQVAETRAAVRSGTSPLWIVGASVAIGLVITVVLVLIASGSD